MTNYNIIKLKFLSPLHIGTGKENHDYSSAVLHSDTLGAAIAAMRAQSGNKEDVGHFLSSFTLSSAFPFKKERLFLPKMAGRLNVTVKEGEEQAYRKRLKKIEFVEVPLWSRLVQGENIRISEKQLSGSFLVGDEDATPIYKNRIQQRVTVPRSDDRDAEPFFFDWQYFSEDAGLYCITDAQGELLAELCHWFGRLGEEGIGTDKNVGGGRFEIQTGTLMLPEVKEPNATLLLSLYIPTKEELGSLQVEKAIYKLVLRGGYMAGSEVESLRHLWKKSIYMFDVGSVFPTTELLQGKLVNLSPAWNNERIHPVYRSGKPFCIPIKQNEYE